MKLRAKFGSHMLYRENKVYLNFQDINPRITCDPREGPISRNSVEIPIKMKVHAMSGSPETYGF